MAFLDQVRSLASRGAGSAKRQARIGRKQIAARRTGRAIRGQKLIIGQALYPHLRDGNLTVANDRATTAVARIQELDAELDQIHEEIAAIRAEGDDYETAHDEAGDTSAGEGEKPA